MAHEDAGEGVRRYVASVLGVDAGAVASVRRFDDGNRHEVSRVDVAGRASVVVRVALVGGEHERSAAAREAEVLERLGGVGAPQLLDHRPSSPWFGDRPSMVMAFVEGRSVPFAEVAPSARRGLGAVVARVHAVPVEGFGERLGAGGDVRTYAAQRRRGILQGRAWIRDPVPPGDRSRLAAAADAVERSWDRWQSAPSFDAGVLALLHGDVAEANVVWSPEPVLIDWEFARLGDPADELAYLFDQAGLDEPARDDVWRGYASVGGHDPSASARVGWWQPLTLLGSTLWWVERWVRRTEADAAGVADPEVPRPADAYLEAYRSRLDRLDAARPGAPPPPPLSSS